MTNDKAYANMGIVFNQNKNNQEYLNKKYMNQIILQFVTVPLIISSLMGIMLHETHLDSAITKIVANKNDIIIKAEVASRMPHIHAHEKPMLEHLRSLSSGRFNAKRNKGENEKKYIIQKRSSSRTLSSDGILLPLT